MLYLININDNLGVKRETEYSLFETNTESTLSGNREFVLELVQKYGMEAKNFSIKHGLIEPNNWPNEIRRTKEFNRSIEAKYILLANKEEKQFKIVEHTGYTGYCGPEKLKLYIEESKMANCTFNKDTQEYKSVDTYIIKNDSKFSAYIALKYAEFRAKVWLLGLDISFDYTIEGEDVRLTRYTGTSRKVILPSFITIIRQNAFLGDYITDIKFSTGLKFIGSWAFDRNDIAYVEFPESVEFIGQKAFFENNMLLNTNNKLDENKYKVLNNKAIVLDGVY